MYRNLRTMLSLVVLGLFLVVPGALAEEGAAAAEVVQAATTPGPNPVPVDPCAGLSRSACKTTTCGTGPADLCIFSNGKCRNSCGTVVTVAVPVPVPLDPCAGLDRSTCPNTKCDTGATDYCSFSNGKCRNPCGTVSTADNYTPMFQCSSAQRSR